MKKFFLSFLVILAFAGYVIRQRFHLGDEEGGPVGLNQNTNSGTTGTVLGTPSVALKDGSYTGSAVDVFYGFVQVKATVSGGKMTDVQFLQYPNDRSNSIRISQQAMPMLKQEALQAQNANVNVISGATSTSSGFQQSLQSALAQATA